jgi:hypothetical protein
MKPITLRLKNRSGFSCKNSLWRIIQLSLKLGAAFFHRKKSLSLKSRKRKKRCLAYKCLPLVPAPACMTFPRTMFIESANKNSLRRISAMGASHVRISTKTIVNEKIEITFFIARSIRNQSLYCVSHCDNVSPSSFLL